MKLFLKELALLVLLISTAPSAFSRIDIRVYQQGAYVSLDTLVLAVDPNDNSGTGATNKLVFFNIYNLSPTQADSFYLSAAWLCSNSSAFYQFCQEYPPDYTSGTCHTFHHDGKRVYDDNDFLIFPDTCAYNYLRCHFFIYDYSVEKEHEKVCRFSVKRRHTHEELDSLYLIIRRGNLPCNVAQPVTGIHTSSADNIIRVYPNPARNFFNITMLQDQLTDCSLYSPRGEKIWDKNIKHQKTLDINADALPDGVYYLKLTDSRSRSYYKKIVVNNY